MCSQIERLTTVTLKLLVLIKVDDVVAHYTQTAYTVKPASDPCDLLSVRDVCFDSQ